MKKILLFGCLLLSAIVDGQDILYPQSSKENIVDTFFNKTILDEYRWLENLNDPKIKTWIEQQNELAKKTLKKASFKYNSYVAIDRYSYVEFSNPKKQGKYYFTSAYYKNATAPAIYIRNSLRDDPSILVDLNFISTKDNIMLKNYSVSLDSKYLAYQFSRNGSDWNEIKVMNINTRVHTKDYLKNVKFSAIAWKDDGFYYSVFPPDNRVEKLQGQEIYYHKLATDQSEDKLIFKRSTNPEAFFRAFTTSDERFLVIVEDDNTKRIQNIFYIDFHSPMPSIKPLLTKLSVENSPVIIDNHGDEFIALSSKNANNGMLVKINPANPLEWNILIPEYSQALLKDVKLMEHKIITLYRTNGKEQIIFYDYQGKVLHAKELPIGFCVSGFNGEKTDPNLLFSYEGYTQPKVVYILDIETFKMNPLKATVVNFDFSDFETVETEFESFDSTKVPLVMIYKKGIDLKSNNPILLKAYGGFGSIEEPQFNPGIIHFLNHGGIFVFANIRGGGDKGQKWQDQGIGINKPNSFNDFIAAAEYLIRKGYTSPNKLAITGGSNGGLVVGVAMTQRPDLFKVAVPVVAPMDMIRFENFTIGNLHTDEYGSVKDSDEFKNIYAYSPLNNIKEGINYPATLIMTSEFDDRVPPFHSYKFAAKLQNRASQKNPILLRVAEGAGHYGTLGSVQKMLKEESDMYDFIFYHLGKN
jgi:prolyl oligopeptidase